MLKLPTAALKAALILFLAIAGGGQRQGWSAGAPSGFGDSAPPKVISPVAMFEREEPDGTRTLRESPPGCQIVVDDAGFDPRPPEANGPSRRIADLLRSRGIRPDGDAFLLVYRENPGVKSLPDLEKAEREAATLRLPRLDGPEAAAAAVRDGFSVRLNLYPDEQKELTDQLDAGIQAVARLRKALPEAPLPTAPAGKAADVVGKINRELLLWKRLAIDGKSPVLPQERLYGARSVGVAVSILNATTESARSGVSMGDVTRLQALYNEVSDVRLTLYGSRGLASDDQPAPPPRVVKTIRVKLSGPNFNPKKMSYFLRCIGDGLYEQTNGTTWSRESDLHYPNARLKDMPPGLRFAIWVVDKENRTEPPTLKPLGTKRQYTVTRDGPAETEVELFLPAAASARPPHPGSPHSR